MTLEVSAVEWSDWLSREHSQHGRPVQTGLENELERGPWEARPSGCRWVCHREGVSFLPSSLFFFPLYARHIALIEECGLQAASLECALGESLIPHIFKKKKKNALARAYTHTHTLTYIPKPKISRRSWLLKSQGKLSRTLQCFSSKHIDHPLFTTSYLLKRKLSKWNKTLQPWNLDPSWSSVFIAVLLSLSLSPSDLPSVSPSLSLSLLFSALGIRGPVSAWRAGGKGVNVRGLEPGLS